MLKLTKFLSLHNEFFGQNIPIRNNALTRIHIIFHVNVLSIPEVIGFGINGVSGLKILAIAVISSSMCLSMKIQKDAIVRPAQALASESTIAHDAPRPLFRTHSLPSQDSPFVASNRYAWIAQD